MSSLLSPYTIKKEYNKLLLENILEDYIKKGIIPTYEQLASSLEDKINGKDLDFPLLDYDDVELKEREASSIAKFSKFTDTTSLDLRTLYNSLLESSRRLNDYYKYANYEIQNTSSSIKRVEQYLKNSDSFGNLSSVNSIGDSFASMDSVNQSRTTAFVSLENKACELERISSSKLKYFLKDNRLDISLDTANQVLFSTTLGASKAEHIVSDDDTSYTYIVKTASQQAPVTLSIVVEVGAPTAKNALISKAILSMYSTNKSSETTVSLSHSLDGYNYIDLTEVTASKYFDFVFPAVRTNFLMFSITKTSADTFEYDTRSEYTYEYCINNISVISERHYYTSVLYSDPLYVSDKNYTRTIFDSATLYVSDVLHPETSIDYYVSVDKNSNNEHTYSKFVKINSSDSIDFNNLNEHTIEGTTVNTGSINSHYAYLNSFLPDDIVEGSLKIWRNVGIPSSSSVVYNGEETGWRKDGQFYKCVFYVSNPKGIIVNFGDRGATLDGEYVIGLVSLDPGYHKFKTHESNWVSVPTGHTRVSDPLYPYNHKLIIEGHDTISLYDGVNFYAAYKMVGVDSFDFLKNIRANDFEKYYIDGETINININTSSEYTCSPDSKNVNITKELFKLTYKSKKYSQLYNNIDSVVVKAVLSTSKDSVTPVLKEYKLILEV